MLLSLYVMTGAALVGTVVAALVTGQWRLWIVAALVAAAVGVVAGNTPPSDDTG